MSASKRARELAREWLGPILSTPGEVRSLADLLQAHGDEREKAALDAVRERAPTFVAHMDRSSIELAVYEAERALKGGGT
jgi:hypothetical protein